ncbi:carboxymuconolactone decarboxylase family protein [Flavobacterium sp. NRK1]|nr:carboxymuconolactone decarboxylase family protein [Flavobacterium sp. NRK1]MCO6147939.1 carboxymuconolactone decarboxylase family protein [Flavobacterium sp. NRK1]
MASQVNDCNYCLPAHNVIGKMFGFTDDQMREIRKTQISFDKKYDDLQNF